MFIRLLTQKLYLNLKILLYLKKTELSPLRTVEQEIVTTECVFKHSQSEASTSSAEKLQDNTKRSNPSKTVIGDSDSDFELPLKRQRSIKSTFGKIYAYSSIGDKTRKINNCLLFMICKDNQPFSIVENEGFRNLLKVIALLLNT